MAVIEYIKLDTQHPETFAKVRLQQNDMEDRKIGITILDNGDLYAIPTGANVSIRLQKPDGSAIANICEVVDNKVIVTITNQMSIIHGRAAGQISILDHITGGTLKTVRFHLLIDEEVINDSVIASTGEFTLLQDALLRVGDADAQVADALADVADVIAEGNTAIQTINTTNTNVQNEENIRITNENERILNENEREQNENDRIAAEILRPDYLYLTQAEYDVLPIEDKENPNIIYEITDDDGVFPSLVEGLITDSQVATQDAINAAEAAWQAAAGTLPNFGTAGTYNKVITDEKGRVQSGTLETTIAGLGVADVYTKTEADDEVNSKVNDLYTIYDDILPFKTKTYQAKGQMHCHTTTSDGLYSPTVLLNMYKAASYDFVAITDHDAANPSVDVDGIIHIRGNEFYVGGSHAHICTYNNSKLRPDTNRPMMDVQGSINFIKRNNGLTSIAHPQMNGLHIIDEEAYGLQNYNMMEIFTAFDGSHYDNFIDNLLKQGKRFNLLAVDDFHNETINTFNGGWIVVNTDEKDKDHILQSIADGNYYSSNGNDISLSLANGVLTATSINSSDFTFVTNKGRTTIGGNTTASYTINGDEVFIRVESTNVSTLKTAWSNPIYINNNYKTLTPIDIITPSFTGTGAMLSDEAYGRDGLVFVAPRTGTSCVYDNNEFTITTGVGTYGAYPAGLLFSSYNTKYTGRTILFSFDLYRVSGDGAINALFYYSSGDKTDVSCTNNRVNYTLSDLYSPINPSGNNIDNYIHYQMPVTLPNNISSIMGQVRSHDDNVVFKIKNFKIQRFDKDIGLTNSQQGSRVPILEGTWTWAAGQATNVRSGNLAVFNGIVYNTITYTDNDPILTLAYPPKSIIYAVVGAFVQDNTKQMLAEITTDGIIKLPTGLTTGGAIAISVSYECE